MSATSGGAASESSAPVTLSNPLALAEIAEIFLSGREKREAGPWTTYDALPTPRQWKAARR